MIDRPGLDSALARSLHAGGKVPLPELLETLSTLGERTLARRLVDRGLLDAADAETVLGAMTLSTSPPGERLLRPGVEIGDYVLGEKLGAGGMGAVYRATHRKTGAVYALKVQAAHENAARFEREARALGKLNHHHVVRVHTVSSDGTRAFLVMGLLPGGDLKSRLREGPLAPREAAEMVRKLASGLAHAHSKGVLHRDLKPTNVMFDENGAPQLVDFGIAKVSGENTLTHTGQLLGTPGYMPPEQADARPLDERADVYGLGAVLYAALTGRAPFVGDSPWSTLRKVLQDPPDPPRSLRPEVPPALSALCLAALAKDPNHRPPSAQVVAERLQGWLDGKHRASISPLKLAVGATLLLIAVTVGVLIATRPAAAPPPKPMPPEPRAPVSRPAPTIPPADVPMILADALEVPRNGRTFGARFLGDGQLLVYRRRELLLVDVASGKVLDRLPYPCRALALRGDGGAFAFATSAGPKFFVVYARVVEGRFEVLQKRPTPKLGDVAFSADSDATQGTLAAGHRARAQLSVFTLPDLTQRQASLVFTEDAERVHAVAARGGAGAVEVFATFLRENPRRVNLVGFDLADPKPRPIASLPSKVESVAFDRERKRLALGLQSGLVVIIEPDSGKRWEVGTLVGPEALGGKDLGSGIDLTNIAPLLAHRSSVKGVAWSLDGRRVYSCGEAGSEDPSEDQTLCAWDVASGSLITTLRERPGGWKSLGVSPNGQALVVTTVEGAVSFVRLPEP